MTEHQPGEHREERERRGLFRRAGELGSRALALINSIPVRLHGDPTPPPVQYLEPPKPVGRYEGPIAYPETSVTDSPTRRDSLHGTSHNPEGDTAINPEEALSRNPSKGRLTTTDEGAEVLPTSYGKGVRLVAKGESDTHPKVVDGPHDEGGLTYGEQDARRKENERMLAGLVDYYEQKSKSSSVVDIKPLGPGAIKPEDFPPNWRSEDNR